MAYLVLDLLLEQNLAPSIGPGDDAALAQSRRR